MGKMEAYITVAGKFKESLAYEYVWPYRLLRYVALLQRGRKRFWISMIPAIVVCIASMMFEIDAIRNIVFWSYVVIGVINFTYIICLMRLVSKATKHVYFTTGVMLDWKSAVHLLNAQKEFHGWLR